MLRFALAACLSLAPLAARAEGCAPAGGEAVPSFQKMNQLLLDSDFLGFVAAIHAAIGSDVSEPMHQVQGLFEEGFEGCTTIAQRRETGGMVQEIVVFHGKPGPLFGYWMGMVEGEDARILRFAINTDIDEVMSFLR